MKKYLVKISGGVTLMAGALFALPTLAAQTADQLFPTASVSALSETVLDRSIDVLWSYWPTILTVAVTIGVAFFLISKALSVS